MNAFDTELRKIQADLMRRARRYTRNDEDARDLVQTASMNAFAARGSFQEGSNFRAWMFTILRNQFLSDVRKDRLRATVSLDNVQHSHMGFARSTGNQEVCIELAETEAAMESLPAHMRQALMLVGVEGCDYETAAEIAGVEIGTIKSRVGRARQRLRLERDAPMADIGQRMRPTAHALAA